MLPIEVRPPAITHKVTVQQIMKWTESAAPEPRREASQESIRAGVDPAWRR